MNAFLSAVQRPGSKLSFGLFGLNTRPICLVSSFGLSGGPTQFNRSITVSAFEADNIQASTPSIVLPSTSVVRRSRQLEVVMLSQSIEGNEAFKTPTSMQQILKLLRASTPDADAMIHGTVGTDATKSEFTRIRRGDIDLAIRKIIEGKFRTFCILEADLGTNWFEPFQNIQAVFGVGHTGFRLTEGREIFIQGSNLRLDLSKPRRKGVDVTQTLSLVGTAGVGQSFLRSILLAFDNDLVVYDWLAKFFLPKVEIDLIVSGIETEYPVIRSKLRVRPFPNWCGFVSSGGITHSAYFQMPADRPLIYLNPLFGLYPIEMEGPILSVNRGVIVPQVNPLSTVMESLQSASLPYPIEWYRPARTVTGISPGRVQDLIKKYGGGVSKPN